MDPKTATRIVTIVLLVLALVTTVASADWSQFHCDPGRTGNTSGDAPLTDTLLWTTTPTGDGFICGGASILGGRVYASNWLGGMGTGDLDLFCLNETTGAFIWKNPIGGLGGASTPAVSGDRVFVGSHTGDLYCVNATNGATMWGRTIEASPSFWGVASSPLICDDTVFVNSFSDAKLHAFDFDGNELWHIDTPDTIDHYASPAVSGGRIFFAGGDPALYCADVSNQSVMWKFNTSDALKTTPAIEGGVIFFATESRMYAVNMAGDEVWSRDLKSTISSPAVAHGKVYIGSSYPMKKLYCLDAGNGSEIWNKSVNGAIWSSPAVADETIYFGVDAIDGTIYALNASDGSVRWSYDIGDFVMSSPSISNGTMFIGSDTGYLYAFGTPDKFWEGNVVLLCGETLNVTARNSGTNYTISRTTALGAFVKTARRKGFNFTINDSDYDASGALFIDSIADLSNDASEGNYWHYWVNYPDGPKPDRGANEYELNDVSDARDVVTFYYGGATSTPAESVMGVEITTQIIEAKPEAIFITVEHHEFIESASSGSNLNITLLHPSDVQSGIDFHGYDLIFLEHISGSTAENLKNPVEAANTAGIDIICIHSEWYDDKFGNVNLFAEHPFILQYWNNYDGVNIARLLTYLEVNFCGLIGNIKDPISIPKAHIRHPDTSKAFISTSEYLDWYANKPGYRYNPDNITIGIASWCEATRSPEIPKLVHTLEKKGANVISIGFTESSDLKRFYIVSNETIVDAVVCTKPFRINTGDVDQGVRDLETLNVPVMRALRLYYMAPAAWRNETSHGISIIDLGFQVGLPEMDGIIDPIVIAGKNESDSEYQPIDGQINWTANRTIGWAHLNSTPNDEKRIAIIYHNHGGGKDNLGAAYLNVPPSLRNILVAMNESGYDVTVDVPDEETLIDLMIHQGTNIRTWAPGELERLASSGTATLIPVETYLGWFGELEAERQAEVIERWGEPPGEIMVWTNETTKKQYFVIPKLPSGNVILAPQPTRGRLWNDAVRYHNRDIPPHHQYIAFYLWLGEDQEYGGFGADAIMHFGKQGTQEWLPGKGSGLSSDDCWPAILIRDMPVIYPYIMNGIAEGTQAKRRGSATMITHLTPPIVAAGLYGNLTNLLETVSLYSDPTINNTVKQECKNIIIAECMELHLDEDIGVDPDAIAGDGTAFNLFVGELADYLYDIKTEFIPYGLHTFGEPPEGEPKISFMISMLRDGYKAEVSHIIGYDDYPNPLRIDKEEKLDNCTTQLIVEVLSGTNITEAQEIVLNQSSDNLTTYLNRAAGFSDDLANCTIEVSRTLKGFDGGYIPPAQADDPIRNPNAIPTGRNFYSMSPRAIPTEEAWETGKKMADAFIERYQTDHDGAYPRKPAIVLWAWTMTDYGVVESEILYLVGARPVWDSYGAVYDVELIDESELGRPRIDVMVVPSGLHRDVFPMKLKLIDRAIRLAAAANDTMHDNYVRENSEEIFEALNAAGNYAEEDAAHLSESRIFLEAPGTYGPNLDSMVSTRGTWDSSSVIGETFIARMHYVYGDEVWGIPGEEVFRLNLAQTDAIVHNMNSNIYGFIDNDDVFQYVGGLASAYRYITGSGSPDVYVTDNRDPDENPTVSSLSVVIHRELRTRYLNPKWIEGMRGEGYAGTREISNFMEHIWGWDATMPDLITESIWQQVYEAYKGDDYTPTTADAVIALRMATGSIPALDWADVSGDGMVTSLDALMILQNTIGG
ncbi:MAG: cobaltochelatase subunit CobN [Candidatus Methanogasteraceae archaeon]